MRLRLRSPQNNTLSLDPELPFFYIVPHATNCLCRLIAVGTSQYPGSFDLKIIGVDDDTFVSDIRKAVAGCLTNGEDNVIKCSTREKGKYTSITLKVHVQNSTQLYKVTGRLSISTAQV